MTSDVKPDAPIPFRANTHNKMLVDRIKGLPMQHGEPEESPAPAAPLEGLDNVITKILNDVMELPDRTSPDDWPEACLVTGDELDHILRERVGALLTATMRVRDEARSALKPFADYAGEFWPCAAGDRLVMGTTKDIAVRSLSVGDVRRARAALSRETK